MRRYNWPIAARSKTASGPDGAVAGALRSRWGWVLGAGILAIGAGFVAIAVPAAATVTIELFIGWVLLFGAGFQLVDAFAPPRDLGRVLVRIAYAILFAAAGIYLLVAPLDGTFTLTVLLAALLIVFGLARMYVGLRERDEQGAGLVALSGVAGVLLGILIAVELPSSADWAIGLLVGVDLLFYGFTAVWTALEVRERAGS